MFIISLSVVQLRNIGNKIWKWRFAIILESAAIENNMHYLHARFYLK